MRNDNKTLADVQPGGMVRLGDQAERVRFEEFLSGNPLIALSAGTAWQVWQATLSAQPSPGGQGGLNYERMFVDACAALAEVSRELGCDPEQGGAEPILAAIAELREALAARQPVGDHLAQDRKMVSQPVGVPAAWMHTHKATGRVEFGLSPMYDCDFNAEKWDSVALYADLPVQQPAQAVDLAENMLSVLIEEGVLARNGRVFQKLRALIDSQDRPNG